MKRKAMYPLAIAAAAAAMLVTSPSLRASETDDRIEATFKNTYVYKTYLKDDTIKVVAKDGGVTLNGQVSEANHKYLAQEAVAGLPGVRGVDNRLEVKLEGTEESDAWIKAKVRSVLAFHRNVSGNTQVDIKDGVITLRGVATSEAQKELAAEYAGDVKGVLRVTNVMTVAATQLPVERTAAEKLDDASIIAQVKTVLLTHRSTSAVNTKVQTRDGVVTLTGIAKNTAERTLVTKLVTDIQGVTSVHNQMTVEDATTK